MYRPIMPVWLVRAAACIALSGRRLCTRGAAPGAHDPPARAMARRVTVAAMLAVVVLGLPAAPSGPVGAASGRGDPSHLPRATANSGWRAGDGRVPAAGAPDAYPRLASINAFKEASQVDTFARYGLIVAPFSAANGAVQALKASGAHSKILMYIDTRQVDLPDFGGFQIYPGWWLTLAGTRLAAPLGPADTTVHVVDARPIAASLSSNPDVLIDGETVHVTGADAATGTLTVRRGLYSRATPHVAGARMAAHAVAWPGSWMLNITRYCPIDPATGQTWSTYLAGQVTARLAAAPWDGIFYDDANARIRYIAGGRLDANGDDAPDGGDGPSGQGWPEGQVSLLARTRALLPRALIMENGGHYPGAASGRMFEHFPFYNGGWGEAFPSYLELTAPGPSAPPSLLAVDTGETGAQDLRAMRFGLGTALMGDGYYAYDYGPTSHGQTWWYDEYDAGAGSSVGAGVDAGATWVRVAAGTGARFRVGDVVRAPSSVYTNAGLTLDDERMRVTRVTGDTLTVERAVGGSLAAAHGAGTKVLTAAQEAAGRGWLGRPLGPARALALASPDLFAGANAPTLAPWSLDVTAPAAATLAGEGGGATGSAAAHVSVTTASGAAAWDVRLTRGTVSVAGGTPYTLSFRARGAAGGRIEAVLQQTSAPYTVRARADIALGRAWRRYSVTVPAGAAEPNLAVQFNLGASAGDAWVDGVSFRQGDANVWRRDFTYGTALLNGTDTARTIALGPGYRHIQGTQDPALDDGAPVTRVTIPPRDAVLLVTARVTPRPIPTRPGPFTPQRPCIPGARAHACVASSAPAYHDAGPVRSAAGRPAEDARPDGWRDGVLSALLALAAATIIGASLGAWRHRRARGR